MIGLVCERAHRLLYRAPLDTPTYLRALVASLSQHDTVNARSLIAAARPAWVAELAYTTLAERTDEDNPPRVEELRADLREEATRRLVILRGLASVATSMGLLGAVLEIIFLLRGDHGLAGLQAGLPQRIALERALMSMMIGVSTAVFALTALRTFRRAAASLLRDIDLSIESMRPFSSKLDSTEHSP